MLGVFLSRIRRGTSITDAFQKIVKTSGRRPKKLWVDQGTDFTTECFEGGWKRMMLKCTASTTKVKLLWWRGLIVQ